MGALKLTIKPPKGDSKPQRKRKRPRDALNEDEEVERERSWKKDATAGDVVVEDIDALVELDEYDDVDLHASSSSSSSRDFSKTLSLKRDHHNRPVWVTPDRKIFLESFSPLYRQAYDFLIAIAEPVSRPQCIHEYHLTSHSLYAAVSIGLTSDTICQVLDRLSKVKVSKSLRDFVTRTTENCGKLKLVIQDNKFFLESPHASVLRTLLLDDVVARAVKDKALLHKVKKKHKEKKKGKEGEREEDVGGGGEFIVREEIEGSGKVAKELTTINLVEEDETPSGRGQGDDDDGGDGDDGDGDGTRSGGLGLTHAVEILPSMVEHVKQRCLPGKGGLNYPILEEYDFQNDKKNPDLHIDLKPTANLRSYQQKSLSKMFSNGRARSGVIVLPCGAGKSLTGVAAASRVKKSVLCLCLNSVSVDQWKHQFLLWTNLQEHQVCTFTAEKKKMFASEAGVLVTTYSMLTHEGRRSEEASNILREMQSKEWGIMLLDEVHVVPAETFRKVIAIVKCHCKLGLTATLVREDSLIDHLNFLIGPKLYEANWLDLVNQGYLANVQCAEVWCEMTKEFFAEYMKKENRRRRELLYVMNPNKFMTCQFLIEYHEQHRKDKVIVFSDNIWALREYALKLRRPFIYGATAHQERTRILHHFKHSSTVNCIFLSRVGDNSIDIPEANVIIQIASHAGARRQEAQRLGRILRPKQRSVKGEFNAFFYSLVSKDTQEMYYSTKRQQFLIDQGYAFKVVLGSALLTNTAELQYSKREDQLSLLSKILTQGEEGDEVLPGDGEERTNVSSTRRNATTLQDLSGAKGLVYSQFKNNNKSKNSNPYRERNFLFKFRKKFQK